MTTPLIYAPDGTLKALVSFNTTINTRFLQGVPGTTTAVAIQVSINGAAWTDDTDYVVFNGTSWTVPNPAVFPTGLQLLSGVNTVAVRSVNVSGIVSDTATATMTLVGGSFVVSPPTAVQVERKDTSVVVSAQPSVTTNLVGVNVYASQFGGGGATGYVRVNVNTVSTGVAEELSTPVGDYDSEFLTIPGYDPLYLSVVGTQQDQTTTVGDGFSTTFEVPETANRLRAAVTVTAVSAVTRYSFEHDRAASLTSSPATVYVSSFAVLDNSVPLYYVVTGVYFDPSTQLEFETAFSAEVAASPLRVTAQVGVFPVVSQQQIVRETIKSILRSNPQVRVDPGSVLRDTFIDPFAAEAERLRFVLDFLHRAQTFAGLLNVDDPQNTGVSVSVSSSPYKTAMRAAFMLPDDQSVQDLIDRSFESLASNYGVFRKSGRQARGEVTFYTTRTPTKTEVIPVGTQVSAGSVTFAVTQAATIPLSRLAEFYNPVTRRYSVTVAVQATTAGAGGNVGEGQVRRVVNGPTSLSVTNASSMFGGTATQTNAELAAEARNALASVDSGTRQGYAQIAAGVPGVVRAQVVSSGDSLMRRDTFDGRHIGGKVDVWVQGSQESVVTDVFAFQYDTAFDMQFLIIGAVSDLTFQVVDSEVTSTTPMVQLLSLRNATTGESFDVTGATLVAPGKILLDTTIDQPAVSLTDVVLGSYRRSPGYDYVFRRQPVVAVRSVSSVSSGGLSPEQFSLRHPDSPLMLGGSTRASDFLRLSGLSQNVTSVVSDEAHVMVGEYPEYLDRLGVDELSIVVTNSEGDFTYATTGDPDGFYDYAIIPGSETAATAIVRVPSGRIADGEGVLVSYSHGENFTVTYAVNQVPSTVQLALDARRHVTADVLAKAAVPWTVDIVATVILSRGAVRDRVDAAIRSSLGSLFASRGLSAPLRQSDVLAAIEAVAGVSYVVVPLTQLSTAEGTTVVLDTVRTSDPDDAVFVRAWSTPTVNVWLLTDPLVAIPVDGGGVDGDFHAVYRDEVAMTLAASSPDLDLRRGTGRAYIIGADGLSIPGYSDDATLIAAGARTAAEVLSARSALTGSRVMVSLSTSSPPSVSTFSATYQTGGDYRVYDITPGPAQYVSLGAVTITYDEDA